MPRRSRNRRKTPVPALVVGVGLLAASGCATTTNLVTRGPLDASQGYVEDGSAGRLAFPVAPETLESALLETLNERGFEEIRVEDAADGSTTIQARGPDHRVLRVAVSPNEAGSQAAVQVGRIGDHELTRDLLERTAIRVGLVTPSPRAASSGLNQQTRPAFSARGVPDAVMLREQAGGGGLQDGFLP